MVVNRQKLDILDKCVIERLTVRTPFTYRAVFPNEACFLHFRSGHLLLSSASGRSEITSADSVLMKCGNYFAELVQQSGHETVEVLAVHLYPELLKELYKNEIPPTLKSAERPALQTIRNSPAIAHFIDSLNFYFENPGYVTSDLLMLKIKELILLLLQTDNAATVGELIRQLFTPRQVSLKELVQAHLFSPFTLSDLAALAGLSLSSFKREFKKTFDDTPAGYIKRKRIEEAKKLLRHSELTVSEICYQVGFNDLSNFSKAFRKNNGCSPVQFRKVLCRTEPN
jgi:AraC family transcriptional regulator, exoenzyme S synthesis regulatory protein ExsA